MWLPFRDGMEDATADVSAEKRHLSNIERTTNSMWHLFGADAAGSKAAARSVIFFLHRHGNVRSQRCADSAVRGRSCSREGTELATSPTSLSDISRAGETTTGLPNYFLMSGSCSGGRVLLLSPSIVTMSAVGVCTAIHKAKVISDWQAKTAKTQLCGIVSGSFCASLGQEGDKDLNQVLIGIH